jgi:NTE family protein
MTTLPETPTSSADIASLEDTAPQADPDLGLVMGGGGARAAYQVGFLCYLAREFPDLKVPIVTGVSSGGINAALLASHHGSFAQAVRELVSLWERLTVKEVFRVDAPSLSWIGLRWVFQLLSGGVGGAVRVQGLVDTTPLRNYLSEVLHAVDGELTGIQYNLALGKLKAIALSTSSYTTGQSLTWIQGQDLHDWTRPQRRSQRAVLTIDHVMASSALPLFFPAVEIDDEYFGDGGVRMMAPLSPAIHLGAEKILAISTRYNRTAAEAKLPDVTGYPPPAQVLGVLLNSVFLDLLDQDALRMERLNHLLRRLPPEERDGLRPVQLLVLRPSVDLGRLANEFEPQLPKTFRFLTRGLGTRQTKSPDFLSMVLFQPDYIGRLIEIGEADAKARADEIDAFIRAGTDSAPGNGPDPTGDGPDPAI